MIGCDFSLFFFSLPWDQSISVDAHPPPTSEEELNPFLIFPQPEENFKVLYYMVFSFRISSHIFADILILYPLHYEIHFI